MTDSMVEKRCYTVKEIEGILGIRRQTVYQLLQSKKFSWIQLDNGAYRISKRSFDNWLDHRYGKY